MPVDDTVDLTSRAQTVRTHYFFVEARVDPPRIATTSAVHGSFRLLREADVPEKGENDRINLFGSLFRREVTKAGMTVMSRRSRKSF